MIKKKKNTRQEQGKARVAHAVVDIMFAGSGCVNVSVRWGPTEHTSLFLVTGRCPWSTAVENLQLVRSTYRRGPEIRLEKLRGEGLGDFQGQGLTAKGLT